MTTTLLGFAVSAPGPKIPRVIEKGRRYSEGKARLWLAQGYHCARCPRWLRSPADGHRHHIHGRGMGGGKRDDRDTELLCWRCHDKAKIERRESWILPPGKTERDGPGTTAAGVPAPLLPFPTRPFLVYSRAGVPGKTRLAGVEEVTNV
jgi:hypothetical protein